MVPHRLAGPAAPLGRPRRRRGPARPPRPRLRLRPLRGRRPRAEEQRDHVGVRAFLATLVAQQIPADTLADRGARGAAVRLLTAHRVQGPGVALVVVAHVQQEGWPDLRRRSTLLQADRIGEDGLVPAGVRARAADGGAPALLRRVHPRARSGWSSPRSRPPRTTASSRRGSSTSSASTVEKVVGRPAPPAVDGRAWSASCAVPSPTRATPRRSATPPPAGWPGWRASRHGRAAGAAAPTRRPGGAPAPPAGRCSRCATPTSRCRCRPACSSP